MVSLARKLRPPTLSSGPGPSRLVGRARAHGLVGSAPIVVVTAPTGYGKSCFAHWFATQSPSASGPMAWYTVDDTDDVAVAAECIVAALAGAWPALAPETKGERTVEQAVPLLGYLADAVVGPGCLVIDNADRLPEAALVALAPTLLTLIDAGVRLVVVAASTAGLDRGDTLDLVAREAQGAAVVLRAPDLQFDIDEVADLLAVAGHAGLDAGEAHARTGGWPLAVGLVAAGRFDGSTDATRLARFAVRGVPVAVVQLLATAAQLSSVPASAVAALDSEGWIGVERFVHDHPGLAHIDEDGWLRLSPVLRAGLAHTTVDSRLVEPLSEQLLAAGELELGLSILGRTRRWPALGRHLDLVGHRLIDTGRYRYIRDLVATIPAADRTTRALLLDAWSGIELDRLDAVRHHDDLRIDEARLVDLIARTEPSSAEWLGACSLLAYWYRLAADLRMADIARDTLRSVLGDVVDDALVPPEEEGAGDGIVTEARLGALVDASVSPRSVAGLLHAMGFGALAHDDTLGPERMARCLRLAERALARSGGDPIRVRALASYYLVQSGVNAPASAVTALRDVVAALRDTGHPDGASMAVLLGDCHLRGFDVGAGISVAELGLDWAERTGNRQASAALTWLEAQLELVAALSGSSTEPIEKTATVTAAHERATVVFETMRLNRRVHVGLVDDATRLAGAACWFGNSGVAESWLGLARSVREPDAWSRQVGAALVVIGRVIDLARGEVDAGAEIDRFVAEQRMLGRHHLASEFALLRRQLTAPRDAGDGSTQPPDVRLGVTDGPLPARAATPIDAAVAGMVEVAPRLPAHPLAATVGTGPLLPVPPAEPRLSIEVLRPDIRIRRGDDELPRLVGLPARLLVLLVVEDGVLPVDRALEVLWPGADPLVTRNRLHGVVLKLRRALGLPVAGPVRVEDGVLRLTKEVEVDAWRLVDPTSVERAAAGHGELLCRLVRSYVSPLVASQFAYDEFVLLPRASFHRRFLRLAGSAMAENPADSDLALWVLDRVEGDEVLADVASEMFARARAPRDPGTAVEAVGAEPFAGTGVLDPDRHPG